MADSQLPLSNRRDTILLLLGALGLGILLGMIFGGRGGNRHQSRVENAHNTAHTTTDNRRINDRKRVGTNVVFGNIVIGSNNAPDSVMSFGIEDSD